MHWTEDAGHPFAGILAKLERADENIVNLNTEILQFFRRSKYPILPDTNHKAWQEAVDYHRNLVIPKRFSVLVGEIIHHFRSSLDHIVWIFSNDTAKTLHENALGFPILSEVPDKNKLASFERQIQGVDKASVKKLIADYQPYKLGADALDNPLCIVHDMDRFDKHRELVIVGGCANLTFPATAAGTIQKIMKYRQGKPLPIEDIVAVQRAVKHEAKVFPQVAFAKFGQREGQFVVPCVQQLFRATISVIDQFAQEL
jgi:hypothetical protein